MTSIQLTLSGALAKATVSGILTAGMGGIPVTIDWDTQWENLAKVLVCRCGNSSVFIENITASTTIPMGVLQWDALSDNSLFLGVEGRNEEGDLVLPSTMAYCGKILPGAYRDKEQSGNSNLTFSAKGTPETVTWHQCPEAVRLFLEQVNYDPNDMQTSHIAEYAPETAVPSNSRPIEKRIENLVFCNERPQKAASFVADSRYGHTIALDKLRYIRTASAPNVRDLGGWDCDGGTIRYGLLFRGGQPIADDREVLVEQLGIRHDLDLRGSESNLTASPLGEDVYYTRANAYNWYSISNKEAWRENLACVFEAVTHGLPVYFHCTAGADRTGTLACVLEGLLGVSRSDIDKDYELTCFATGTGTDNQARRRNESEWQSLISAINAKAGNTFRDKCVSFAVELGFRAAQINAYRAAMIDGSPELLAPDIAMMEVVQTLDEGIVSDNQATQVAEYQRYQANISCQSGFVMDSVRISMGGADITASCWQGTAIELAHEIRLSLNNCRATNSQRKIADGQAYVTTIVPNENHTLKNAQVIIMMGGKNVSNYYSEGVINIPQVTGKVEITISAVEAAPTTANQMTVPESGLNKRISGTTIVAYNGCFITDAIAVDLTSSCTVTFKGFGALWDGVYDQSDDIFGQTKLAFLDSNQSILNIVRMGKHLSDRWILTAGNNNYTGNLTAALSIANLSADQVAYVRFSPHIGTTALTASDLSDLEIQMPIV